MPIIDKTNPKFIIDKTEKQRIKRIEKFKNNFKTKTLNELNEMLNNDSKYQREAIMAVKEILKEKTPLVHESFCVPTK